MNEKLERLAKKIEAERFEYMIEFSKGFLDTPEKVMEIHGKSSIKTRIIPGKKYTKVDIGSSGKYMVVNDTGEIYGVKAYGVIHKGHRYGTLETIDDYYWGNYTAVKKG